MQGFYEDELRDLLRMQRFMKRFSWPNIMSDDEVMARAALLSTSDGTAAHYAKLREEGRRSTRPAFLTGIVGAPGEPTKQSEHNKLRKLFAKL